jgi:gluconate 2-dehydrogenase gamma chain
MMKSRMLDYLLGRRAFIVRGIALAAAGAMGLVSRAAPGTYGGQVPWTAGKADPPATASPGFLNAAEREFLEAAVARLIPADELGPGAREAGCTEFIDRQLSGPYGQAEGLYMQGPWQQGSSSQGFQSRLTPAQAYRTGIAAIETYCRNSHGGESFSALRPADQDALLSAIESGRADIAGADGKAFFEMLLQNTLEGFWSDPLYGGNRDFIGWNLIGFPGARYDYRDHIANPGERYPLPPVGLKGRKDWSHGK